MIELTAFTWSIVLLKIPFLIGYHTFKFFISKIFFRFIEFFDFFLFLRAKEKLIIQSVIIVKEKNISLIEKIMSLIQKTTLFKGMSNLSLQQWHIVWYIYLSAGLAPEMRPRGCWTTTGCARARWRTSGWWCFELARSTTVM